MDTDDLEPARPVLKPLDLDRASVGELKDYILALEEEIARSKAKIAAKAAHLSGAAGLFRKP